MQRISAKVVNGNENHQIELERLQEKHQVGIDRLKIDLQTQCQSLIQEVHDKYNQQIADLLHNFMKFDKPYNKKEVTKNVNREVQ